MRLLLESAEREARLVVLDRLAGRLIETTAPVVFRAAASEAEREAIFRLRARTVLDRGWLPADALPGGREADRFDDGAALLGGWLMDELVAAARLVWPGGPAGSPLSTEFGIVPDNAHELVHLDRICVARDRTDGSGRLTVGLIGVAWLAIRAHGYCRFSGIDSAAVTRLYRRLGFAVSVAGEPRSYWGAMRSPVLFDPLGNDALDLARLERHADARAGK